MAEWYISKLLSWADSYFQSRDIDSPRLTAEILLGFCLKLSRLELYLQHDRPLHKQELAEFKQLIHRRLAHEPVAYIVGERGFFQSDFHVTPAVLIPRPETELLVEKALELLSARTTPARILDLGTGSGAIVVSIAREYPEHEFWAVDISFPALCVASVNASRLSPVPIRFIQSSWMESFAEKPVFDLILANPPYIPTKDVDELSPVVRLHEPRTALDGGESGLDDIAKILEQASCRMAPEAVILMETGFDQKEAVQALVMKHQSYNPPVFFNDLAGNHRLALVQRNPIS